MKLSDYAKVIQTVVGLTELSVVESTALVQKLLITETADLDTALSDTEKQAIANIAVQDMDLDANIHAILTGSDNIIPLSDEQDLFSNAIGHKMDELDNILRTYSDFEYATSQRETVPLTRYFTTTLVDQLRSAGFTLSDAEDRLVSKGVRLKRLQSGKLIYQGLRIKTMRERNANEDSSITTIEDLAINVVGLRPSPSDTTRYLVKDVHNRPGVVVTLKRNGFKKKDLRNYYLENGVREIVGQEGRVYVGLEPVE